MADMTCSECGGEMDQIEKTTFSGRDMREYECRKCGRKEIVDQGIALWKAISDAREPDKD
jgi:DNA-directed RNA polymerase subunit RPC12/RpoP